MEELEYSKIRRAVRRFDLRRRKLGSWAYALNHITGVGLVVYLYLHMVILSMLFQGPGAWNTFVSLARSPYVLVLDVILFAGALIHGLNGLRIALTSFSLGIRIQKTLFSMVMIVSVVALAFVAFKVFGG